MKDFHLYVILDRTSQKGRSFVDVAKEAILGGADVIQLRDKEFSTKQIIEEGKKLRQLTRQTGTILIVNDRVDIALAVEADGVHLGQEDLPLKNARRRLGAHKIIGRSTHDLSQALKAQEEGADYIGVGPVFATPTKPAYPAVGLDLVRQVNLRIGIPFVAIGGINVNNIHQVLSAGARRVAVVRAVAGAEDIRSAAKALTELLQKNNHSASVVI